MAAVVNINTASLNAQRNLTAFASALAMSLQRLSASLRINSAKGDAASRAAARTLTIVGNGTTVTANVGINNAAKTIAASAGDYHKKIEGYSQQIARARSVDDLSQILYDMLRDTRSAQEDALRSQHDMSTARREVQAAEARIHELEAQLVQMSELAYEDQLTGSLNRRGLDDVLKREMARSERKKTPLCVALLDLDDFKKLNDTHGHSAGDGALVHLVRVVKETLRSMDVIARFGGEEFMIVLPDTPLDKASETVTRVQRELAKQLFMHDNNKILIAFSAGVAQRRHGEDLATLVQRADEAAYQAKRTGKNRVVAAE